ncbi:putative leader peptide [Kitasatospora sp. NPDC051914]
MRQTGPVTASAAQAVRLLPMLTSRRHIDLLRVCSSLGEAARRSGGHAA